VHALGGNPKRFDVKEPHVVAEAVAVAGCHGEELVQHHKGELAEGKVGVK
jgi:hypothetical protein